MKRTVTDFVALATKHGVKLVHDLKAKEWHAEIYTKGRKLPMATMIRDDKTDAAHAACQYLGLVS